MAEAEAAAYASHGTHEYLGLAQSFWLLDPPGNGKEVFSLIRESGLGPSEYINQFFDTGRELQPGTESVPERRLDMALGPAMPALAIQRCDQQPLAALPAGGAVAVKIQIGGRGLSSRSARAVEPLVSVFVHLAWLVLASSSFRQPSAAMRELTDANKAVGDPVQLNAA